MSHYRPYPAYKDSGVEWLGMVPEHWDELPLKYVIDRIDSGTSVNATDTPARDGKLGVLKTSCVYSGQFDPNENKEIVHEEYGRASCPLQIGSLIVSRMNTPDLVGAAGLVTHAPKGIFLPDRLWQISFSNALPSFAYYWTQSAFYRAQVKMVCTGTSSSMQNLSQDQFRDFTFIKPSTEVQRTIVIHLNLETARIDALVSKKTRFIELLREKRQALITHAVTKGLDPNVRMKDSGVEWLGDVPEHWEVIPLRYLIEYIESGTSVNATDIPASDGEIGVLKTSCVYSGIFDPTENKAVVPEEKDRVSCPLQVGTLIVSRMNTPDLVGAAGLVIHSPKGIYLPDRLWQISFSRILSSFAYYWTQSVAYRAQVKMVCTGTSSSMQNLSQDQFRDFIFAKPSAEEQAAIVTCLDRETTQIDTLITKTERSIELLKERRSALITAAVTGQIDLREAV